MDRYVTFATTKFYKLSQQIYTVVSKNILLLEVLFLSDETKLLTGHFHQILQILNLWCHYSWKISTRSIDRYRYFPFLSISAFVLPSTPFLLSCPACHCLFISVPDPDPHVFGPLTCKRYGSRSFYHQAKIVRKTLIPTVL